MAQADYSIANQSFPATRSEINSTLSAIATTNSGTSAPTTQFAGQMWIDTTTTSWVLYVYDGSDDIQFATIDTVANTINFTDSTLDVVTDTSPQLGGMLDVNGQSIGDGTLELIKFAETASAVNELTITNSATGNAPQISATGDDTNIDLRLNTKGTGGVIFNAGAVATPSITTTSDTNTGIFFPAADTIAFAEGGTEAMRINSSGNVALAGNIGLGGATPTTSGTGITFPATASASTNANTLDDYEEGTFTPNIGGTATYNASSYGRYVKIGRQVSIQFLIEITLLGTGSVSTMSGLPFTSDSGIGSVQTGCVSYFQNLAVSTIFIAFYIENGLAQIKFVDQATSDANVGNATPLFGNGAAIYGAATYFAA